MVNEICIHCGTGKPGACFICPTRPSFRVDDAGKLFVTFSRAPAPRASQRISGRRAPCSLRYVVAGHEDNPYDYVRHTRQHIIFRGRSSGGYIVIRVDDIPSDPQCLYDP